MIAHSNWAMFQQVGFSQGNSATPLMRKPLSGKAITNGDLPFFS